MNLTRFEEFLSKKQKVTSFKPDVPQEEVLLRLVSVAQKTPSLLNLQPTRFVIIKAPDLKESIFKASWVDSVIRSAPMLVAFAGDRKVFPSNPSESFPQEAFELLFSHKPLGFGWLFKALLVPCMRLFSHLPELPAVHKRAWLYKEISLCAMSFMLAAEAAGLSVATLDYFDERMVKKILSLPRSFVVPHIFAIGYARDFVMDGPFLPLEDVIIRK